MLTQCRIDRTWTRPAAGRTGALCGFCKRRFLAGMAMLAAQAQAQAEIARRHAALAAGQIPGRN